MSDDHSLPDLISPHFLRGELAEQEQRAIRAYFAGHVHEVVQRINDGKEATVWLCRGDAGLFAAKMYRARKFRAFRNDADYAGERHVRDRRLAKAIRQGSRTGARASQVHWVQQEWQTLERLQHAGVRVPQPIAHCEAGILMEFIGDDAGPAPRLAEIRLPTPAARAAWHELQDQLRALLDCGIVHGDLSAYNLLWHRDQLVFIDLPQAISTEASNGYMLFARDLRNVCRWFERAGVDTDIERTIDKLWRVGR